MTVRKLECTYCGDIAEADTAVPDGWIESYSVARSSSKQAVDLCFCPKCAKACPFLPATYRSPGQTSDSDQPK